jgi:hypothetical protein
LLLPLYFQEAHGPSFYLFCGFANWLMTAGTLGIILRLCSLNIK